MASQPTKSGYTGDALIAFEKQCKACGTCEKAYFLYASEKMRARMRNDRYFGGITGTWENCPSCLVLRGAKLTAKWLGQVNRKEVDEDLAILNRGVSIDYDMAENDGKNQEKEETEYIHWKEKQKDLAKWKAQKQHLSSKEVEELQEIMG